ncbi:hypothetical protein DRQ15_00810 [candidate division KSB1 bacterium]|nr:MAG: hypothetical protein DRQ15_00810 [candidate division KSB1 bacterium]
MIELKGSVDHCAFTLLGSNDLNVFNPITSPLLMFWKNDGGYRLELQALSRYLKIEFHEGCKGGNLRIRRLP